MSSKRKRKFVADELAELLTPGGGAGTPQCLSNKCE